MSEQSLKTNSSKSENLFLRRTVFGGGEHTLFVRRKRHYMQMFPKINIGSVHTFKHGFFCRPVKQQRPGFRTLNKDFFHLHA